MKTTLVCKAAVPQCLLEFLVRSLPGWKRNTVKDRLKRGAVSVNGGKVTRHDHPLQPGDRVEVLPARMAPLNADDETGIRLLYDDPHLVVIDKPPGLLSVASESEHERTAMRQTRVLLAARGARRGGRLWAVHRLDQETSGAMMFARSRQVQRHFRENWKQVEKVYLAIVEGIPSPRSGTLVSRLREGKNMRVFIDRNPARSKAAASYYRTLQSSDRHALLEVALETGRKHQIRVQLAAAGHPVAGDTVYGTGPDPLGRLALHSHRLDFTHPYTRERLTVTSPLPQEMLNFTKGWKRAAAPALTDAKKTVYIGIGSNHNAGQNLPAAVRLLQQVVRIEACSRVYETEAVGETSGEAAYLNAVVAVETALQPSALEAQVLKPIEKQLRRSHSDRSKVAIDLDILIQLDKARGETKWLRPPQALEPAHIVMPLADVAPELRHPITGEEMRAAALRLGARGGIVLRPEVALCG